MAENENVNSEKVSLDGGNFGLETFEVLAESSLVGTLVDVGLTAVSNLPTHLISAGYAPYVALVVAAIMGAVGIRRAYKRNRA
jgi:hypothetical protein